MVVDCDMRKWIDRPHWRFNAELLGTDAYGTWLGARPPVPYTGPRGAGAFEHGFVMLLPDDGWWIASFNDERHPEIDVYVDITTVPHWPMPSTVTAIDLDLNVIRFRDGTVIIDDEDEFAVHREEYAYPNHIVDRAIETADAIRAAIDARTEPFGHAHAAWLARVVSPRA